MDAIWRIARLAVDRLLRPEVATVNARDAADDLSAQAQHREQVDRAVAAATARQEADR